MDEASKRIHELYDISNAYATAEAKRTHLTHYRKSLKAILMKEAEVAGHHTAAAQEREAYAHPKYIALLTSLADATEEAEKHKWHLMIARAGIELYRTKRADRRAELSVVGDT